MPHIFQLSDYSVFTGNLRDTFTEWLRERSYSQLYVLTDENTHHSCLPVFLERSGLPDTVKVAAVPAGEYFKSLATCQTIWQEMLDAQLDRKALVINLGGGVIGDMGGFCAATWKRGVDFVQIPTTLLAMTDASIGGKLGIDFQGVKNTIGVFKNPAAVFVDPDFLRTLPERELRSGFAEVIKHALIGDPNLWETIRHSEPVTSYHRLTTSAWSDILRASIAVKVRVVQEDPLEKGLRAILNFGHTIGHALESYFLETDDRLTHGEAVAIGMVCESRMGNFGKLEEVIGVIKSHFLHRPIPEAAFSEIWNVMQQDKKNTAGKIRMAVPGAKPFSMHILEPNRQEIEQSLLFYNELSS